MGVVVISRQVGSFGDEIAELAAGKLGYRLVTREEIHEMGRSCDREFREACQAFESETQPGFFERLFFSTPAMTALFEALTYEMAGRGDVVILGRGAQVALADIPDVFRARIVAPKEVRIKRLVDRENISVDEAISLVRDYDHHRQALIQMVYQRDLKDWSLYDLIINTAGYSAEAAADIVVTAVERKELRETDQVLRERLMSMALAKRVESSIKKKVATTSYRNVTITADSEGKITLTGHVPDKRSRSLSEKIAREHPDVRRVENLLRTTGLTF